MSNIMLHFWLWINKVPPLNTNYLRGFILSANYGTYKDLYKCVSNGHWTALALATETSPVSGGILLLINTAVQHLEKSPTNNYMLYDSYICSYLSL